MNLLYQRVKLSGIVVDLLDQDEAVSKIIDHALMANACADFLQHPVLSVVSANLDHIVQFGDGGRWDGVIGNSTHSTFPLRDLDEVNNKRVMHWLTLLDGAPLVAQSQRLTSRQWPRLAGSDLIGPLLDAAEAEGFSVGFLGGSPEVQERLARQLTVARPSLEIAGFWAPDRAQLQDQEASVSLAQQIHTSGADILVVGLGKPRQELWMAAYGGLTGASVLLAFGAVIDFLAGAVKRAPVWVSGSGLEWAWRLALEPKRLARRYLLHDPPGLLKIRRDSKKLESSTPQPVLEYARGNDMRLRRKEGTFVGPQQAADVTVLVVTYNNEDTVDELIASLRHEAQFLDLRVVFADNDSFDGTLAKLATHPDVITMPTRANLGYAGGINHIRSMTGDCKAVLVLNPDLVVIPGSIRAMLQRQRSANAGIIVPRLLEADGSTFESLRREPSLGRALGDALFGERLASRPGWASEIEFDTESYEYPHRVDWATGAAVLIESALHEKLGPWDEQFFLYSEETDYFRRARESGAEIWYEPAAKMIHHMGGSGASVALNALMSVNRIRYVRKYRSARYAQLYGNIVKLHEGLRCTKPAHKGIYSIVSNEERWRDLPSGTHEPTIDGRFPSGSVIIPAHNEATVIARTLRPLAALAARGAIQVVVSCNGCTDDTAQIAQSFDGVTVVESEFPSKVSALNFADLVAGDNFPRLYLDADITITSSALRSTLEHLHRGSTPAARPAFEYDATGASWLVKAFYRARRRIPSTNEALWGAGAYAVNREGRSRFGLFPDLTADDLYIDQLFTSDEKAVLPTVPIKVHTPRTPKSLLKILTRNYRGQQEVHAASASATAASDPRQTLRHLTDGICGPLTLIDVFVYVGFVGVARWRAYRPGETKRPVWERDDSSRTKPINDQSQR